MVVLRPQRNLALRDGEGAVGDVEGDVGVVLGGRLAQGEGAVGETHVVGTSVGALGLGLGAADEHDVARRNAGRQRGLVDREVGDRLLGAVVLLAAVVACHLDGDGLGGGGNGQLAGGCLSNYILISSVDLADGAISEGVRVLASIGALATRGLDALKRDAFSVRVVARDRLFLAAVLNGAGLSGQGDVLVVVELDDVLGRVGREALNLALLARDGGVALDGLGRNLNRVAEGAGAGLVIGNLLVGAVPVVLDGVGDLVTGVVEVNLLRLANDHGHGAVVDSGVAIDDNRALSNLGALDEAGQGLGRRDGRSGAIKVVVHLDRLVHRNVLGVVVHVARNGDREGHGLGAGLVGVPTHELIGDAAVGLGVSRRLGGRGNRGLAVLELVVHALAVLGEARGPCILQIEVDSNGLLALDLNLAVEVIAAAVVRDLVGVQNDGLNVVLGDGGALLLLERRLPRVVNGTPVIGIRGLVEFPAGAGTAVRPRHDAIAHVVVSVLLIAVPGRTFKVQRQLVGSSAATPSRKPVGRVIRGRICRRAVLEEEIRSLGCRARCRNRHVMGGREDSTVLGDRRGRNGDGALLDAHDLAGGIDGGNARIARRPRHVIRTVNVGGQRNVLELLNRVIAIDDEFLDRGLLEHVDGVFIGVGLPRATAPLLVGVDDRGRPDLQALNRGGAATIAGTKCHHAIVRVTPGVVPAAIRALEAQRLADIDVLDVVGILALFVGNHDNDVAGVLVNPAAAGLHHNGIHAVLGELILVVVILAGALNLHAIAVVLKREEATVKRGRGVNLLARGRVDENRHPEVVGTGNIARRVLDVERTLVHLDGDGRRPLGSGVPSAVGINVLAVHVDLGAVAVEGPSGREGARKRLLIARHGHVELAIAGPRAYRGVTVEREGELVAHRDFGGTGDGVLVIVGEGDGVDEALGIGGLVVGVLLGVVGLGDGLGLAGGAVGVVGGLFGLELEGGAREDVGRGDGVVVVGVSGELALGARDRELNGREGVAVVGLDGELEVLASGDGDLGGTGGELLAVNTLDGCVIKAAQRDVSLGGSGLGLLLGGATLLGGVTGAGGILLGRGVLAGLLGRLLLSLGLLLGRRIGRSVLRIDVCSALLEDGSDLLLHLCQGGSGHAREDRERGQGHNDCPATKDGQRALCVTHIPQLHQPVD